MVDAHMKDGRTLRLERDQLVVLIERRLEDEPASSVTCWGRWRRDHPFAPLLLQKIGPGSIGYIVEVPRSEAQAFLAERLEHLAGKASMPVTAETPR